MSNRSVLPLGFVVAAVITAACSSNDNAPYYNPYTGGGTTDAGRKGDGGNGNSNDGGGSQNNDGGGGGGQDASGPQDAGFYDFGCGGNTACPQQQVCCSAPGNPTTYSCVAPASCTQGNQINCDGPDECSGATPVCCGVNVPNGMGKFPNCGSSAIGTSCTSVANCPTHLGTTCTDTSKVVICHASSDCTDATNNKCCTFNSNGATLTFCTDSLTSLGATSCN
jgi:hypothetical protein